MYNSVRNSFRIVVLPLIVILFLQSFINLVDTYFVSWLGPYQLSAINIVFPIFFLLIAIGEGFSVATNNLVSKSLGSGEYEKKDFYILISFLISLLVGFILFVFSGYIVNYGLLFFNVSEEVMNFAKDYLYIIYKWSFTFFLMTTIFSIFVVYNDIFLQLFLSIFFILINIFLNWFLIHFLGWGIEGAAYASVFSIVSIIILGFLLFILRGYINFQNLGKNFNLSYLYDYFKYFISGCAAPLIIVIEFFVNNYFVSLFGDLAVASYGIGIKLYHVFIMVLLGFGFGMMNILGYYIGNKDYTRIKELLNYTFKIMFSVSLFMFVILFVGSGSIASLFSNNAEIIYDAKIFIIMLSFHVVFFYLYIYSIILMQIYEYHNTRISIVLLLLISIFIFEYVGSFYGLYGVWIGWLLASILNFVVSYIVYLYFIKNKIF